MAKFGEGDERWIVSERQDGTNVHGWHWQEKDALQWSRERLDALCALEVCDGSATQGLKLRCTGVASCTGEAYVNKRKGKIIPGYEIELKVAYEGSVEAEGKTVAEVKGTVHFPYIADENADEDPEAKVLNAAESPADLRAKEEMRKIGLPKLYAGIREFVKELAAGGPGGDAPDPKDGAAKPDAAKDAAKDSKAEKSAKEAYKSAPLSKKAHTIKLTERFYCRPQDVLDCLTDPGRVRHFTQSVADVRPGPGPFSMFDGNIHGETTEYVPGERLVQKWRFRNWPEGHFSTVTITFREPEPGNTFLELVQENVPEADAFGNETVMDTTEMGWKEQIFSRIRSAFGFGC